MVTLSLISNGIKYLGSYYSVAIIFAIIFSFFMGLYTNTQPNNNEFILVKSINEIIQAPISSSNKNLVEICKSIPMNDTKMDKIRNEGTFRKTKTGSGTGNIEIPQLKGGKNVKNITDFKKYNITWT